MQLPGIIVRKPKLNDYRAKDVLHKLHNIHVKLTYLAKLTSSSSTELSVVFSVTTCPVFYFEQCFKVIKCDHISMSSSPVLWVTGKLYRGECVSVGGLEGLRGPWGLGDGHGVRVWRDIVCCLRCFCNEPFNLRQKGSSGGRHSTNSMQEWLLKVCVTSMWDKNKHLKEKICFLRRKLLPGIHVMLF